MDNLDILNDFIIEAEEIYESLGEELLSLEREKSKDCIDAIFRGYHTIKGGASFLKIKAMVDLCHECENIFSEVRSGTLEVSADLIDTFFKVQDVLGEQIEDLKNNSDLTEPEPELEAKLKSFLSTPASVKEEEAVKEDGVEVSVSEVDIEENEDIINDIMDEFENEISGSESSAELSDIEDELVSDIMNEFENEVGGSDSESKAEENTDSNIKEEASGIAGEVKNEEAEGRQVAKEQPSSKPNSTVRVDTDVLDYIMNMVGELVLVRNRLVTLDSENEDLKDNEAMESISKAISNLNVVTSDIQLAVMKTRMQPIKKVFGRFPRMIRDLSKTLGKDIKLVLEGEETDLDKNLVEELADPLIHLVRNSADHGIETIEAREALGKTSFGTIKLSALQQGDSIHLSISDDGSGIDVERIKEKAISNGVVSELALRDMAEGEILNLIFEPGFSTAEQVTDISGRGVGLDVVRNKISKLNGTISIDSTLNSGTTFLIKVPLTLAIMRTLMVGVYNQIFAIPLVNVKEILNLSDRKINVVDGIRVLALRDTTIPLYYLSYWFFKDKTLSDFPKEGNIVVVQIGNDYIGFVVDSLLGQEEVVVKPLSNLLSNTQGLSGATITGNGNISLILDIPSLINEYVK